MGYGRLAPIRRQILPLPSSVMDNLTVSGDGERQPHVPLRTAGSTTFLLRLSESGVAMIDLHAKELEDDVRNSGPRTNPAMRAG